MNTYYNIRYEVSVYTLNGWNVEAEIDLVSSGPGKCITTTETMFYMSFHPVFYVNKVLEPIITSHCTFLRSCNGTIHFSLQFGWFYIASVNVCMRLGNTNLDFVMRLFCCDDNARYTKLYSVSSSPDSDVSTRAQLVNAYTQSLFPCAHSRARFQLARKI